ncbi:MAG TPA: tRNA uridine-5-carboxymethylaminomethyl(34) synthesis GTPase MnmE [Bacteroidales bacterium]|nr:tRNA uridine-5-carboxymethylaminomethyl(34) synthesis GTPase MnmE [Bacteroidales bacterium]HPM87599.1 tRNA uridine-5-carboxymethylaminomethyl(34) synthesis GTPase MnmE [Bacteroidales bacterium]
MIRNEETICAPATSGGGAIAVIRISGPDSIPVCDRIFFPSDRKIRFSEQKGYTIVFGEIRSDEEIIDEVLISVFRAPHSYTGEDSVEISCHASPYIQQRIIELLIRGGARAAKPGEFTQRAFFNGKMDLSQAEAVADLVASDSRMAHRIAINQLRGSFSDEISMLRADLLHFASLIELELDFGEEDVEFADRSKLVEIVDKVLNISEKLTSSFSLGNAVKEGVPVVIAGNPNTGKSTLLNLLLKEEKAIVSEIPGTTRDAIEDTVVIDGIRFRFTDTAGLRETTDIIENLGIRKTHEKIESSSIILLVADINEGIVSLDDVLKKIRKQFPVEDKKIVVVVNKIDTVENGNRKFIFKILLKQASEILLFISAKTGEGINELKSVLSRIVESDRLNSENVIITNIRHYDALLKVSESLRRVRSGLDASLPEDLIAIDIRHAIHYLGEITGQITTDEILSNIFKNFCIGK